MFADIDLLRDLMLRLESKQVSPRSPIAVMMEAEATALKTTRSIIASLLYKLQKLEYIEGPGEQSETLWLFRKLTDKGRRFVAAARDPVDWHNMKNGNTEQRG